MGRAEVAHYGFAVVHATYFNVMHLCRIYFLGGEIFVFGKNEPTMARGGPTMPIFGPRGPPTMQQRGPTPKAEYAGGGLRA